MNCKFAKAVVKKLLLSPDLARTIVLKVVEQSLPQIDPMPGCAVLRLLFLYCMFQGGAELKYQGLPLGQLGYHILKGKTNQYGATQVLIISGN